ncbi:MAG: hypothetical protein ACI35P_09720 [Bacillus sp. (in: firmicutes)]
MQARLSGSIQIAAVYVGTIVGAGFATGREIVEFFTKYGFYGFLGILLAGYLFIFLGTKVMMLAVSIEAKSYEEINLHLFGDKWGVFINFIFILMLFGVTAVMLSGAGAVFEEQVGLTKVLGVAITIFVALFILFCGIRGLFAINMIVVPMMVFFSFLLFFQAVKHPLFVESFFYTPVDFVNWRTVVSPFLYSAFNLALAQAVLVPVATEIKDPVIIKRGGIMGGICLTLILLSSHLSLMTLPNVMQYDIPSAELMKNMVSPIYWIFIFVIYGEIFTSLIGNAFGLERQIQAYVHLNSASIYMIILFTAFFISVIPYSKLLSFLYPLFGYISLLFMVLLFFKKNRN